MVNFRVMIKTSGGNFIYPVDQLAAKVENNGIRYDLVGNFRTNDRILIRKTGSDKITLEGHIIPTLWSRSERYRKDREQVFEGDETAIPKVTRLSSMLNEIIITSGSNKDPVRTIMSALPDSIEYSYDAVSNWIHGKVMLPKNPEVLEHIAKTFSSPNLLKWHDELKEQEYLPVRRIRVLHSGIRALLARPVIKEEVKDESKTVNFETEENKKADNKDTDVEKISSLADAMRIIRDNYQDKGEELFSEFVSVATVLLVSEIGLKSVENIKNNIGSESTEIERGLVSFTIRNQEKMKQITDKYKGTLISETIGELLKKRSELFISGAVIGFKMFSEMYNTVDRQTRADFFEMEKTFYFLKHPYELTNLDKQFYEQLLKGTLAFDAGTLIIQLMNSPKALFISRFKSYRLYSKILSSHSFMVSLNNLLSINNLDNFVEQADKIGFTYPKELLRVYKKNYYESKVIRHLYGTFEEFEEVVGRVDSNKNYLKSGIRMYKELRNDPKNFERRAATVRKYGEFLIKYCESLLENTELKEIKTKIDELGLPNELAYVQDQFYNIRVREFIKRTCGVYGISSIYEYQQNLKQLLNSIKIDMIYDPQPNNNSSKNDESLNVQGKGSIITDFNMFKP